MVLELPAGLLSHMQKDPVGIPVRSLAQISSLVYKLQIILSTKVMSLPSSVLLPNSWYDIMNRGTVLQFAI